MVQFSKTLIKNIIKQYLIMTHYEGRDYHENVFRILRQTRDTFSFHSFLDIGCGDGCYTIKLAEFLGIKLQNTFGIDYDEIWVNKCKEFFHAEKVDLEFGKIPFEDNTHDLVCCNQVIEHLKNFNEVIDELIRVTRCEGYIVIGIPNLAHLLNRLYMMFGMQPLCISLSGPHVRSYTHKAFLSLLRSKRNIEIVKVTGSTMYPLPYFIAKHISKHFVSLSGYACYLIRKTG